MKNLSEFIRVILSAICIVLLLGLIIFLSSYQGEGMPRPWNWIIAFIATTAGYGIVKRILETSGKSEKATNNPEQISLSDKHPRN
jgi:hypothetical protein